MNTFKLDKRKEVELTLDLLCTNVFFVLVCVVPVVRQGPVTLPRVPVHTVPPGRVGRSHGHLCMVHGTRDDPWCTSRRVRFGGIFSSDYKHRVSPIQVGPCSTPLVTVRRVVGVHGQSPVGIYCDKLNSSGVYPNPKNNKKKRLEWIITLWCKFQIKRRVLQNTFEM